MFSRKAIGAAAAMLGLAAGVLALAESVPEPTQATPAAKSAEWGKCDDKTDVPAGLLLTAEKWCGRSIQERDACDDNWVMCLQADGITNWARENDRKVYNDPEGVFNGRSDAARHCLWMGAVSGHTTLAYANKLGWAHELPEGAPSGLIEPWAHAMDLHNNAVMRTLVEKNRDAVYGERLMESCTTMVADAVPMKTVGAPFNAAGNPFADAVQILDMKPIDPAVTSWSNRLVYLPGWKDNKQQVLDEPEKSDDPVDEPEKGGDPVGESEKGGDAVGEPEKDSSDSSAPPRTIAGTIISDNGLYARAETRMDSAKVGAAYAYQEIVQIQCQTRGETVTGGPYGDSDLWDRTDRGWLPDTWVHTGTNGMVAPECGSTASSGEGEAAIAWYRPSPAGTAQHNTSTTGTRPAAPPSSGEYWASGTSMAPLRRDPTRYLD